MDSGTVIGLLTALGGGAILTKLVEALIGWIGGKPAREQSVWDRYDNEAKKRRMAEEHAAVLRRLYIEGGLDPAKLPAWPVYSSTKEKED